MADPQRSVFIDDRPRNIDPAAALGMHTILYQSASQLADELRALGVNFNIRK